MTGDTKPNPAPTIARGTRIVLAQPCDDSDDDQRISITVENQGAGGYVLLRTARWALDGEADLDALVAQIRRALALADGDELR